jgi:hypothetical protein
MPISHIDETVGHAAFCTSCAMRCASAILLARQPRRLRAAGRREGGGKGGFVGEMVHTRKCAARWQGLAAERPVDDVSLLPGSLEFSVWGWMTKNRGPLTDRF